MSTNARKDVRHGVKVFTHDLRSPIQTGRPVWDGRCPHTLPTVNLDVGSAECASGWNYGQDLKTVLPVVGLWPDGRPSRTFAVEASPDAIARGQKRRASQLTILRELSEEEIGAGIRQFSSVFTPHAQAMADEQMAWRAALGRPFFDRGAVADGLQSALSARGLAWGLREYRTAREAWGAWEAREAREAWEAREAREAWEARGAWGALVLFFAGSKRWISTDKHLLTVGIREAYQHGLEVAIPVAPNVLGWVMAPAPGRAVME